MPEIKNKERSETFTHDDIVLIKWVIDALYEGRSWIMMSEERPEIDSMVARLEEIVRNR